MGVLGNMCKAMRRDIKHNSRSVDTITDLIRSTFYLFEDLHKGTSWGKIFFHDTNLMRMKSWEQEVRSNELETSR